MSDFSYLNRPELVQLLLHNKTELNKQLIKTEPADGPGKANLVNIKKRLEAEIKAIEAQLKETVVAVAPPTAAPTAGDVVPAPSHDEALVKSMREQAIVQKLNDVIGNVPKMVIGDSMERFVADMDQIYEVEVKDQVAGLQKLEDEFVRATKRLLINTMFSQMNKSGEDTSTWELLKKYLITHHGSKITMFQHLTRLWNLELKSEEKLTDFAAKLEDQIHTASIHIKKLYTKKHTPNGETSVEMSADDVFKLVGAMLTSIQVKKNHEDIFRSMIKKMDTHWTASSLAADAQDYIDRLGATDNVTRTGAEVSFLAKSKTFKSSDQKKPLEDESSKAIKELQKQNEAIHQAIKSLTLTNMSSKTGGRSGLGDSKYNDARSRVNASKPRHEQICFKYNYGKCKGQTCPDGRRHVEDHVAHAAVDAAVDEVIEEAEVEAEVDTYNDQRLDSLFQFGPNPN